MKRLDEILPQIENADRSLVEKTQRRLDQLTKPHGSLGRLEDLAKQLVGITRQESPSLAAKVVIVMAGDHGVAEEGVSAYPQEVTGQMVLNFLRGGAAINVLGRHVGARVVVVDMGVAKDLGSQIGLVDKKIAYGTRNITKGPAMSRAEALGSIEAGIEVLQKIADEGLGLVATGDMGIANTTASSAIVAAITGYPVEDVTGRGTGIGDQVLCTKIEVVKRALGINDPDIKDPIDLLSKVGGFEIGGLTGVILAGAALKIPVVIDGFISSAAALIATGLEPKAKQYLIASHCSAEKGHSIALHHLGLRPLLSLDLRLGEGTGAALAMNLIEASIKLMTEMATFKEAKVSEKTQFT